MAQFNFSCPHCNQLVQADDQWTGQQIQCPVCAGGIIVPANAAATPPPPPAAPAAPSQPQKPVSKLKVNAMHHAPAPTPPQPPQPPAGAPRPNYAGAKPKKSGDAAKWIKMGVAIVAFGVAFYFGFGLLSKWQTNLSNSKDDGDSGLAGEAGHIVALNDVLDRTDPDHMGMSSKEAAAEKRRSAKLKSQIEAEQKKMQQALSQAQTPATPASVANAAVAMASQPLASGVWSMDLETNIPEGRANGMIAGTNFVVDAASLVKVPTGHILRLQEGTNLVSDRELFVSFQIPPGEELAGHNWSISEEMKGKGVPQVIKRWKTNPKFAPSKKIFATGYSMKLEFDQPTNGIISGKISVSLPDPEHSYVVGAFKAAVLSH